MTDDKLMAMARAAGYSMIPPQEPADGEEDSSAEAAPVPASALDRVRSWLPHSASSFSAAQLRGTFSSWLHSRAHA